jgi:hypothetical protein
VNSDFDKEGCLAALAVTSNSTWSAAISSLSACYSSIFLTRNARVSAAFLAMPFGGKT